MSSFDGGCKEGLKKAKSLGIEISVKKGIEKSIINPESSPYSWKIVIKYSCNRKQDYEFNGNGIWKIEVYYCPGSSIRKLR